MRYGRHSVENYDLEHPDDRRVAEAREQVAKLSEQQWQSAPGESLVDYRHRVEQSFNQIDDADKCADRDRDERNAVRDFWIEDRTEAVRSERARENRAQHDPDLKVGGQVAARAEVERCEQTAREGKNPALNRAIDDLTEQQAARQEHITNDIVGPALEAKLQELGLDQVKEEDRTPTNDPPATPPNNSIESEIPDQTTNAQHIPEDVMASAEDPEPTQDVNDERLARLQQAYEDAGTPAPATETQTHHQVMELEQ